MNIGRLQNIQAQRAIAACSVRFLHIVGYGSCEVRSAHRPESVMHRVAPTDAELRLIAIAAKSIKGMNKLAQIGILQALVSSPDALNAQLKNMAKNGTVPAEFAAAVQRVVDTKPRSAKLEGLATLIAQLKKQKKERWRLVVFTTRRETQTTIEDFLRGEGLNVGLINGESGQRNQNTIKRFWQDPPDINVIVSTEAGSEGVNLQVANVLVNYDLPWNPMIVEQRIGRVQRLASEHKNVSIFNVMLAGTFEEYIVGRLMEKLQMAAHAIGDIESLLQGAGADDDEDSGRSFEERILDLVLDALQGKDVAEATRLAAESIDAAQTELEREEKNINELLGSSDGKDYVGPRAPVLPAPERSMDVRTFSLAALPFLGAKVTPREDGMYLVEEKGAHEIITFELRPEVEVRASLYTGESPPFQRLIKRVIASGLHDVNDADAEARAVQGIRAMLTDPDIAPWVLQVWRPGLAHVSVAAYVQNHTGGADISTGVSNWLRLYPPNDYLRERRQSVRVTTKEAASVMGAQQKFLSKYKKPMIPRVGELPGAVRARAAMPRIVQGILEFREVDRLTEEQIRTRGALEVGSWIYEQA